MAVLLLLSGGKDSRHALKTLLARGETVHCLVFDGRQRTEWQRAVQTFVWARGTRKQLHIERAPWFDELTWQPLRLLYRDVRMGVVAIRKARQLGCKVIATGVKRSDEGLHKWLGPFLFAARFILWCWGLRYEDDFYSSRCAGSDSRRGGP
jgi:7-cyano-7-deazaguanine synthase in queuosine biosynthesis